MGFAGAPKASCSAAGTSYECAAHLRVHSAQRLHLPWLLTPGHRMDQQMAALDQLQAQLGPPPVLTSGCPRLAAMRAAAAAGAASLPQDALSYLAASRFGPGLLASFPQQVNPHCSPQCCLWCLSPPPPLTPQHCLIRHDVPMLVWHPHLPGYMLAHAARRACPCLAILQRFWRVCCCTR